MPWYTYYHMYSLSYVSRTIFNMKLSKKEKTFLLNFGLELRRIREERDWTLEKTEEMGWPSWRHLQQIESGKNITLITLKRILKLYNIPVNKLI